MAGPLTWCTEMDDCGNLLVRVAGVLDLPAATGLRLGLLKALAEQPRALLVDLSGVELADRLALTVFSAVTRQAALWPGIPLVLCAPAPALVAGLTRGAHRRLVVHPSVAHAQAELAAGHTAPRLFSDQLLPVRGAARYARDMVTEVCLRWEVPHLTFPASLVVSELVSNAVQHANTMVTLRFSLGPRHLMIAAEDGSTAEPVLRAPAVIADDGPSTGRGLQLVQALTLHWGSLPTGGGKIVWASLALAEA